MQQHDTADHDKTGTRQTTSRQNSRPQQDRDTTDNKQAAERQVQPGEGGMERDIIVKEHKQSTRENLTR